MGNPNPLMDLSYRGYNGPLEKPTNRWVVIMRQGMKTAFQKRAFWVLTALSGWYYLSLAAYLYVVEQIGLSAGQDQMSEQVMSRIIWHDQLINGFTSSNLFVLATLLLLGAGSIANDNRSNALLVFLSKPTTKLDYLVGKWMGLFVPMVVAMGLPSLVFIAYGALNFASHGFFTDDPWMIPKTALMIPLMAAFQTSLIIGLSSLFNQGRLAGATYAGIYFLGGFFTQLLSGFGRISAMPSNLAWFFNNIQSCSIFGETVGIEKLILKTSGTPYWAIQISQDMPPIPHVAVIVLVGLSTSTFCLLVAWQKIKAVEVVR